MCNIATCMNSLPLCVLLIYLHPDFFGENRDSSLNLSKASWKLNLYLILNLSVPINYSS